MRHQEEHPTFFPIQISVVVVYVRRGRMKNGDLIRYREWREGDPPPDSVKPNRRSWGNTGIVISVCKDKFGNGVLEPAVEYMNQDGELCIARQEDVYIINKDEASVTSRELSDTELEYVVGGQTREKFEEWRCNVINDYRLAILSNKKLI